MPVHHRDRYAHEWLGIAFAVVNYRSEDAAQDIRAAAPDGIDRVVEVAVAVQVVLGARGQRERERQGARGLGRRLRTAQASMEAARADRPAPHSAVRRARRICCTSSRRRASSRDPGGAV